MRGTCCWPECQSVLWPQSDPWPLFILSCIDERDLLLGVPVSIMTSVWPLTPVYLVMYVDERDLLIGVPVSSMTSVWPLTPVYLVIMHRTKGPAAGSASQYYYLSLTLEHWPLFILSLCIDQRDLHAGSASHSYCSMTPVWPLTPVYLVIMYRWEGPAARSASQDADGPCHQCSHGHTQSCLSLPGEYAATCSTVILEAKTYYMPLHSSTKYTERQKKLITSSEWHTLKSKA